jgi:hypothetical protein
MEAASKNNPFVGAWDLVSFTIFSSDGSNRAWGDGLHGLLIYTETGHVSVSINKKPVSSSPKDVLDSVLFYAGNYAAKGSTIVHQVTQATNPSRIGREMIRYADLNDSILTLRTPVEAFGSAVLVWRKLA